VGVWRDQVLPRLTDRSLRGNDLDQLRAQACAGLAGRVLEIGFGSGLNIPHYPPEVTRVDAVEPSAVAWGLSQRRREGGATPIERRGLDGQRLDAGDASYDAVLTTFTLCSIHDLGLALSEIRRVLVATGRLHFLEHGLAPDPAVATWQRRLEPAQRRLAGGCHLTRDIPKFLTGAGLEIAEMETGYLPGPRTSRPWTYTYRGRATA
jgi:SAM-dependent methyltransferase